jgi:hypothetical protein
VKPALPPLLLLLLCACGRASEPLPLGTWGGEDAGVIVEANSAHVHIGCTKGDTDGPLAVDDEGRFEATGTYDVDAFPVERDILHPARFSGRVSGETMTLEVRLTDSDQRLGPVTLRLGQAPAMRQCPICRTPAARHLIHAPLH